MNYPANRNYDLMCYICLHRIIKHGGMDILVLYESNYPKVADKFKDVPGVKLEVKKGRAYKGPGSDHFNIRFKLPNLADLDYPFIFIDSDMYVISDLSHLTSLKAPNPWIGTNHQWIPKWPDTHRKPFLNSGLQIVSNPEFYDFRKIIKCHEKAGNTYLVPGRDQALLFRYFRSIGYDYTHPDVSTAWNSCALVGRLQLVNGGWTGRTVGLEKNHPVHINHYWCTNKPWQIKCPLHASYAKKVQL